MYWLALRNEGMKRYMVMMRLHSIIFTGQPAHKSIEHDLCQFRIGFSCWNVASPQYGSPLYMFFQFVFHLFPSPQALKDALLRMSGAVGTVCMILTTVSWFSIMNHQSLKSHDTAAIFLVGEKNTNSDFDSWKFLFERFELILNMIHLYYIDFTN